MKRIMFLLVVAIFMADTSVFAQDNGTNSMFSRNRAIRASRNYSHGGWSYRVQEEYEFGRRGHSRWRGPLPGIRRSDYSYSSFHGGYGHYGSDGRWVALAMTGADAAAGIFMNSKNQNTIRDANDKEYQVQMRQLEIQEAREIREFRARQEQVRWEREQAERPYHEPQSTTPCCTSPVAYSLPESRSFVVENHASCAINIKQNEVFKVGGLESGKYQAIYFEKEDGTLRLQGLGCKLSHSFVGDRIIVTDRR